MRIISICLCLGALAWAAPRRPLAASLQAAVDDAMAGRAGAAVVLDVESGRLLAQNRPDVAARRLVSPGSVIKPFTLQALIAAGIVDARTTLMCGRRVRIGNHSFDCTHVVLAEPLDATAAIAYSCNYFFTHFALQLQDSQLRHTFAEAGLESRTGLAASEVAGRARAPGSVEERQLQAIGEAAIEVTPLGLAASYRRMALNLRRNPPPAPLPAPLRLLREALDAASSYGTARLARPPGVQVAGKTGTSSAAPGRRTHAWFAGYAPSDRPEIVVVVFLEQGSGGADAAPIAGKIFSAWSR